MARTASHAGFVGFLGGVSFLLSDLPLFSSCEPFSSPQSGVTADANAGAATVRPAATRTNRNERRCVVMAVAILGPYAEASSARPTRRRLGTSAPSLAFEEVHVVDPDVELVARPHLPLHVVEFGRLDHGRPRVTPI